jgi:hypothetical protein
METYVIVRRNGWRSAADLAATGEPSTAEGRYLHDHLAWIRSYVPEERDGSIGTVCIFRAASPEIGDYRAPYDGPH